MTDVEDDKPIKEKKINNKIKINPKLGEAVEEIGGTLLEAIEVDEMDYVIESVYDELIEEGFSEDEVEESIEIALSSLDEKVDPNPNYSETHDDQSTENERKSRFGPPKRSYQSVDPKTGKHHGHHMTGQKAIDAFNAKRKKEKEACSIKGRLKSAAKKLLRREEVEVDEGLSIERRKKAAEIGAKSSSYKTRFAAMKLASGDENEVRGSGNKAAKRAAKVSEAVYGGGQKKEEPKPSQDDKKYMTVTAADKAGNTLAYQRFKAGDKRYKMFADHMKESSLERFRETESKKDSMGDVIKDFYKSDAPQFKGRSKEKRPLKWQSLPS